MPNAAIVGTALPLAGTVQPDNATNRTIAWSVYNAGSTGAEITDNTLTATAAGTVTVRATIADGAAAGTGFTQDLFYEVMGFNPSHFTPELDRPAVPGETQGRRPVEMVTWLDAVYFANLLSKREGLEPVYTIGEITRVSNGAGRGYRITAATRLPPCGAAFSRSIGTAFVASGLFAPEPCGLQRHKPQNRPPPAKRKPFCKHELRFSVSIQVHRRKPKSVF